MFGVVLRIVARCPIRVGVPQQCADLLLRHAARPKLCCDSVPDCLGNDIVGQLQGLAHLPPGRAPGSNNLVWVFLPILEDRQQRSEEHTSELQSLMRISYAVFCLKTKNIRSTV